MSKTNTKIKALLEYIDARMDYDGYSATIGADGCAGPVPKDVTKRRDKALDELLKLIKEEDAK